MSFLAPYTNAMRLGQGFNSYTQETCIENAVLIEPAKNARTISRGRPRPRSLFIEPTYKPRSVERRPQSLHIESSSLGRQAAQRAVSDNAITLRRQASKDSLASAIASDDDSPTSKASPMTDYPVTSVPPAETTPPHKNVVQIVTYSSRLVDNVSDIVEALNISSSASIKYGTVKGAGSTSIVNENKVNQSDLNYIVTVKVTNETSPLADRMTFNPIPGMENSKFTEVFGDCFISGFTEGGEFSAIISIKISDKSKVSAVRAAAEAQIAVAAAPGLAVGTKDSIDRHKSDVWDDTETTISVNWAGGGDVKPVDDKWDLQTVVDVATRFPHLVQTCAQRTSAILTRYTSLRSFNEADARNPPDDKFRILDYELCSIYTQDLFSGFLAYKNIWGELSDMLKHPEQYRERDPGPEVPNPIKLTPKGMNEARMLARSGMTRITDITKALITEPSLAGMDENGQQRGVAYMWPGELRKRLPVRHHGQTIRQQADLVRRDTNFGLLTGPEIAKIGGWAQDDDLEFCPLVGDHLPIQRSWVDGKGSDRIFCTLDSVGNSSHVDPLTKLRIHAHENHTVNWLGMFGLQTRSKRCHKHVSGIGFSTAADSNVPPREDGIHHVAGKANRNHAYWSQPIADLTRAKAAKVKIEYTAGSGCLAGLAVLDPTGQELTSWKSYGQARASVPAGLKTVEQEPPDSNSSWTLVGFWGHSDPIAINSVGAIWRKA